MPGQKDGSIYVYRYTVLLLDYWPVSEARPAANLIYMCGRFVIREVAAAERYFNVHGTPWQVSYNIAPTDPIPVVRLREGERVGINVRWGLIPFFARGVPLKASTINARIETLDTAATFRGAWQRGQRCILVASGFYEWHMTSARRKVPHYLHLTDRDVFGFAGLWDRSRAEDGTWTESCTMITMPGNEILREIHNTGANPYRMPAILTPDAEEAWLAGDAQTAREALHAYPSKLMTSYEVSIRVNTPKNNDETLIAPAPSAH